MGGYDLAAEDCLSGRASMEMHVQSKDPIKRIETLISEYVRDTARLAKWPDSEHRRGQLRLGVAELLVLYALTVSGESKYEAPFEERNRRDALLRRKRLRGGKSALSMPIGTLRMLAAIFSGWKSDPTGPVGPGNVPPEDLKASDVTDARVPDPEQVSRNFKAAYAKRTVIPVPGMDGDELGPLVSPVPGMAHLMRRLRTADGDAGKSLNLLPGEIEALSVFHSTIPAGQPGRTSDQRTAAFLVEGLGNLLERDHLRLNTGRKISSTAFLRDVLEQMCQVDQIDDAVSKRLRRDRSQIDALVRKFTKGRKRPRTQNPTIDC